MNNSIEIVLILVTIVAAAIMIYSVVFLSVRGNHFSQRVKSMQIANTYIKPSTFRLFTNGGPNPCDNDAKIERTEIVGIDDNIFIKRGI